MEQQYDVLIVGGGPGGYSAALYSARAGLSTLVVEMLSAGGQMATTSIIDNYPGFEDGVDGFELGEKMQKGAERFGAKTEYAEVTALELDASPKRVVTTAGTYEANAVILATGAAPRMLGLAREEALRGKGVAYCATCDGMYYKGKTVAVAGGGNSAAEDALHLAKLCAKVYVIHRRDALRATALYARQLEQTPNVEFIWDTQIDALLGEEHLTGLALTNKKTGERRDLAVDGVFVAIGRVPNSALAQGQVELDGAGYLAADESTRTSVPGVFAVGDVRTKALRQVVTAAADGAVAAHFAGEYLAG